MSYSASTESFSSQFPTPSLRKLGSEIHTSGFAHVWEGTESCEEGGEESDGSSWEEFLDPDPWMDMLDPYSAFLRKQKFRKRYHYGSDFELPVAEMQVQRPDSNADDEKEKESEDSKRHSEA